MHAPARDSTSIVFNTLLSREEASGTETKLVAYLSVVRHAKASPITVCGSLHLYMKYHKKAPAAYPLNDHLTCYVSSRNMFPPIIFVFNYFTLCWKTSTLPTHGIDHVHRSETTFRKPPTYALSYPPRCLLDFKSMLNVKCQLCFYYTLLFS